LTKTTLTGTANQVAIVDAAGSITLSLPQNIHTAANPSFNRITGTASGGGTAAALRAVSTGPGLEIRQTGAATNEKSWDFLAGGGALSFRAVNDANNAATTWLQVDRTGVVIDTVTFPKGRLIANETFQIFTATIANVSSPFWQTVTFPTAFPSGSTVRVFALPQDDNGADYFVRVRNVTRTSFQFISRNHSSSIHTGAGVVGFFAIRQS